MVGGASRKVRADVVPCRSALVGAGRGPRADMAFLRTSGARGLMETVNADAGRRRLGAVSGGTDRTIGADMRRSVDAVGGGRTDGADMRRSMDAMTMSAGRYRWAVSGKNSDQPCEGGVLSMLPNQCGCPALCVEEGSPWPMGSKKGRASQKGTRNFSQRGIAIQIENWCGREVCRMVRG